MRLTERLDVGANYPQKLRRVAMEAQSAVLADFEEMSDMPSGMNVLRDYMMVLGAASALIKEFSQNSSFLHDIKKDGEPEFTYSVGEIFDILKEVPSELSQEILLCAEVKKPAVIDYLMQYLSESNKNGFVKLLKEEECNLSQVQKRIAYYELINETTKDHPSIVEGDSTSLARVFYNQFIDIASTFVGSGKREYWTLYYKKIGNTFLDLIDKFQIDLNNIAIDDPDSEERENDLLSSFSHDFGRLCYEFAVLWLLVQDEYLTEVQKAIYKEFIRTPEYAEIYDEIEESYYDITGDSPFINVSKKQIAAIIEVLREKATHKAGNKAKNKDFCRGDVLDAIVALKLLGVFVVPKNDNNGLKDLTRWLDDNIPHSDLSKPENQYRVNDYLRDGENEYKDAVRKDIAEFKDLGIG